MTTPRFPLFLFSFLLLSAPVQAEEGPAALPTGEDREVVERGGWASRLRHRSELRDYSRRIHGRSIDHAALKDYLQKGGDPTVLTHYGADNPLMRDTPRPLLNTFIRGQTPFRAYHPTGHGTGGEPLPPDPAHARDDRPDRLRSLKLLLDNGALPDRGLDAPASSLEDALPLLWASWLGDVEAMALLIDHGANVNSVQTNIHFSSGAFGPPLLVAQHEAAADLLLAHGADPAVTIGQGRNLVQELVLSSDYASMEPFILAKLRWLRRQGIRFDWPSDSPEDPLRMAVQRQRAYASPDYAPTNPYLPPGPERARRWEEIAALLKEIRRPAAP